jgi:hypothetical protein
MLANTRLWNILLRTAHIAVTGILLGGHVFDMTPQALLPWLWASIGTGIALGAMEAGPHLVWFHQARGLMTLAKLAILCAIPFLWPYRVPMLLAVVVLASVGSHMPAKLRYYSVVYRTVIRCGSGPGVAALEPRPANPADENEAE